MVIFWLFAGIRVAGMSPLMVLTITRARLPGGNLKARVAKEYVY